METDPQIFYRIILIIILTGVNAFFSGAEMAIVSVNKTKIKNLAEQGNKNAVVLEDMLYEPTNFLSTIQVAITFAGFLSSAAAATGLSEPVALLLAKVGIPTHVSIALSVPIITIILSYITLVLGELVPKRIALQNAEKMSLAVIKPITFLSKIMTPFVKLLAVSTNGVLRLFGMNVKEIDEKITEEEIRSLVAEAEEIGVFNETEKGMIEGIFMFDDKLAKEIMTPRTEVYMIDAEQPESEYMEELVNAPFSRIPVYEGSIDNIIGILYIKDLFKAAFVNGFDNIKIQDILQQAYFVPERKNIDVLFQELQESKNHLAVLVDEYGGFSGIVTIEDMIEEIMGEIEDEYDEIDPDYWQIAENIYGVKGLVNITDLNSALELEIDPESEEFDTIGGYLIHHIGYIPEENENNTIILDGCTFRVTSVKENRIEELEIEIHAKEEELLETEA